MRGCGLLGVPVGGGFLLLMLVAPRVFRAPEAPAAREARRPHFVRRRASKPGQAPPPPTGTAARPSGPSGALHTSGAVSLTCGSARRLEARSGPAAADQHRGQTPPPTGTAARPSGPSGALRAGGGGGFALHEAFRGRVVGVSGPRVVQFPPFGGVKATA